MELKVALLLDDCKGMSEERFIVRANELRKSNLFGKLPTSADFLKKSVFEVEKVDQKELEFLEKQKEARRLELFYRNNADLFARHFSDKNEYFRLIAAGDFEKIKIILRKK